MNKISFIIPVYNEVKTVRKSINDVINLKIQDKEIIIIDNGSSDGSVEIINTFKDHKDVIIFLKKRNTGYGNSIIKGFELSSGKYVYIQYADLEYDQNSVFEMYKISENNNLDAVFGSRFKNQIKLSSNLLKILIDRPSYLATFICTFLINFFYDKNFKDIIGGKFYKLESVKKIDFDSKGPGFDFEFVSKLCKYSFKIGEIFVKYIPRENSKEKKIKPYHMINALYQIFKVKFFN